MFIDKVYEIAQKKYGGELDDLSIVDVRIGSFLTGVKLSNGFMGMASVIQSNELHQVDKKDRDFGDFSPMHIIGKKISQLFEFPRNTSIIKVLKIASLNAYFHGNMEKGEYKIHNNIDPIDFVSLEAYKNIVMVGAFNSYIKKISKAQFPLRVLELDEKAFLPQHAHYYYPAEKYPEILPTADMTIITGLTLVNDTLEDLLKYLPPKSMNIIVGPSASVIPDLFFQNNIRLIGGTRITRPENIFDLISQGAAGYHLFEYGVEKITIAKE